MINANEATRFVYYQPNKLDLKDKVGDCQIRALCKALDKEWLEVFDLITPICREQQVMDIFSCDYNKTKDALKKLGFSYQGVSNKKGTKRPTVKEFAKTHPNGRYICKVAHHVVAVVDGKYYDTWDSGNCSLYGYFIKERSTLAIKALEQQPSEDAVSRKAVKSALCELCGDKRS